MRRAALAFGLLLIVSVLARVVWLRSMTVASAYRIRELRGEGSKLENENMRLRAKIAAKTTPPELMNSALRLGVELDPPPGASKRPPGAIGETP